VKLLNGAAFKFDSYLPIYNWIYPLTAYKSRDYTGTARTSVFSKICEPGIKSRALYFHIPFCETICSFCPFVRSTYSNDDIIELYVAALIKEIELKADWLSRRSVPIAAIFFGGGTPSLLSPDQIRRIGETINANFDLSRLREFSFEFEVKSITEEKLAALREVGVSHARFGLQTFSERYRRLFQLTATLDQIHAASEILPRYFARVSCDLIYGMNGQTEVDLLFDIDRAASLNLTNIDYYPINNLVTQGKLHRAFAIEDMAPTSGLTKYYMNGAIRECLRNYDYLPHNGHGYVKCSNDEMKKEPVVTRSYSFVYHEHVYGYDDHDLIGFGVNAVSSTRGITLYNEASRERYIRSLSRTDEWQFTVCEHPAEVDAVRGVALRLPYHGFANCSSIKWDDLPATTLNSLDRLIGTGLIDAQSEELALTLEGWQWYVNVMYYLLPKSEQLALDRYVKVTGSSHGRVIEETQIPDVLLKHDSTFQSRERAL
jgi:coproporphyrinogen III oxidase-like Fe-S oxidoreductase